MQVIWLKRDLRLSDHEPLRLALKQHEVAGPVVLLYLHEPSFLSRSDSSAQHLGFAQETLAEMRQQLNAWGSDLVELTAEVTEALDLLHQHRPVRHLWAHEEVTHPAGFARDRRVRAWARQNKVRFHELAQNNVSRAGRGERLDFSGYVNSATQASLWNLRRFPVHQRGLAPAALLEQLKQRFQPTQVDPGAPATFLRSPCWPEGEDARPALDSLEDKVLRLGGGRLAAMDHIERFMDPSNLKAYPSAISSPLSALERCSRLSPYLAWGVVSDREVVQALTVAVGEASRKTPSATDDLVEAGRFFVQRLYWRSAYLQSAELRPEVQTTPAHLGLALAREEDGIENWLNRWAAGQTGIPYVDAAMRMLNATGWLNMRLRGTVTSFALNDLWLPWQGVGEHLAREFLDYEPAIHWHQIQIHAGMWPEGTPLTYDVLKQGREHDASGEFVRRWVPELQAVPLAFLHEPWKMSPSTQASCGFALGRDYPEPLVRLPAANDAARQRVQALRDGLAEPVLKYWREHRERKAQSLQSGLF